MIGTLSPIGRPMERNAQKKKRRRTQPAAPSTENGRNSSARRRRRLHRVARSIGIHSSSSTSSTPIDSATESGGDVAPCGDRPMPSEADESAVLAARAHHLLKAVAEEWSAERWDGQNSDNGSTGKIDLSTGHCSLCDDLLNEKLSDPQLWRGAVDALRLRNVPPAGIEWVRNAVITHSKRFTGTEDCELLAENLTIIPGAKAAFDLLGFCIFQPGDAVITVVPTYPRLAASFSRRSDVSVIPVEFDNIQKPSLNIERFQTALESANKKGINVRAIAITNPLDPLGYVFSESELLDLCKWAVGRNLFIIADEVLACSASDPTDQRTNRFQSLLSLRNHLGIKNRRNLIWVWSVSKDLGVPGARFGVVYTESQPIQKALHSLTAVQPCAPVVQYLVGKLLLDADWLSKMNAQMLSMLNENRNFVFERLNSYGIKHFANSSAGMAVSMDLREYIDDDTREAEEKLWHRFERVGVVLSPGNRFGSKNFVGWFRMNIATQIAQLDEALQRIHTLLLVSDRRPLPSQDSKTEPIDLDAVFRPMVGETAKADRMSRDSLLDSSVSSGGPNDFELNQTVRSAADSGHSGSTATLTEIAAIAVDEEEEEGAKTPVAKIQLQTAEITEADISQHRAEELSHESYEAIFAQTVKSPPPPLPPRPQRAETEITTDFPAFHAETSESRFFNEPTLTTELYERIFTPEPQLLPDSHSTPVAIRAEQSVTVEPTHLSPDAPTSDISPGRPQSAQIPEEIYESIFERTAVSTPPPLPPRHRRDPGDSALTTDFSAFLNPKTAEAFGHRTPSPLIDDDLYEKIFERERMEEAEGKRSDTPIPELDESVAPKLEALWPKAEMTESPLATPKASTAFKMTESPPATPKASTAVQGLDSPPNTAENVETTISAPKPLEDANAETEANEEIEEPKTIQRPSSPQRFPLRKHSAADVDIAAVIDSVKPRMGEPAFARDSPLRTHITVQRFAEPKNTTYVVRKVSRAEDRPKPTATAPLLSDEVYEGIFGAATITPTIDPAAPASSDEPQIKEEKTEEPTPAEGSLKTDRPSAHISQKPDALWKSTEAEFVQIAETQSPPVIQVIAEPVTIHTQKEVSFVVPIRRFDEESLLSPQREMDRPLERVISADRSEAMVEHKVAELIEKSKAAELVALEITQREEIVAESGKEADDREVTVEVAHKVADDLYATIFPREERKQQKEGSEKDDHENRKRAGAEDREESRLSELAEQKSSEFTAKAAEIHLEAAPSQDHDSKPVEGQEAAPQPPKSSLLDQPTQLTPAAPLSDELFETVFIKSTDERSPPPLPPRSHPVDADSQITTDFSAFSRHSDAQPPNRPIVPTLTDEQYERVFSPTSDSADTPMPMSPDRPSSAQIPAEVFESIFKSPPRSPPPLPPRPAKASEALEISTDFSAMRRDDESQKKGVGEPTLTDKDYERLFERLGEEEELADQRKRGEFDEKSGEMEKIAETEEKASRGVENAAEEGTAAIAHSTGLICEEDSQRDDPISGEILSTSEAEIKFAVAELQTAAVAAESEIEAAVTEPKITDQSQPEKTVAVPTSGDSLIPDNLYESIFTSPTTATAQPPPLPPRPHREETQITTDFRPFRRSEAERPKPAGEPTLTSELYEQIFSGDAKTEKSAEVFEFGDSAASLQFGDNRQRDDAECPSIQTRSSTDAAVAQMGITESRLSFAEEREPLVDAESLGDGIDAKSDDHWVERVVVEATEAAAAEESGVIAEPTIAADEEITDYVAEEPAVAESAKPLIAKDPSAAAKSDIDWIAEIVAESVATIAAQEPVAKAEKPGVEVEAPTLPPSEHLTLSKRRSAADEPTITEKSADSAIAEKSPQPIPDELYEAIFIPPKSHKESKPAVISNVSKDTERDSAITTDMRIFTRRRDEEAVEKRLEPTLTDELYERVFSPEPFEIPESTLEESATKKPTVIVAEDVVAEPSALPSEPSSPTIPLIAVTDTEPPISPKICAAVADEVVEKAIGDIRESDFPPPKKSSTATIDSEGSLSAALDNAPPRRRHNSRREIPNEKRAELTKSESIPETVAEPKSEPIAEFAETKSPQRVVTIAEIHTREEMPSSPLRIPTSATLGSHSPPKSPRTPPASPRTPTTPTDNWIATLVGKALGVRRLRQSVEDDAETPHAKSSERRLSAELILRADDLPYQTEALSHSSPAATSDAVTQFGEAKSVEPSAPQFARSQSVDETAIRKTSIVEPIAIETAAAIHSHPDAEVIVETLTPIAEITPTPIGGDQPPPVPRRRRHKADVIVGADPLSSDESDLDAEGFRSAKQSFVAVKPLSTLDRAAESVAEVVVSTALEREDVAEPMQSIAEVAESPRPISDVRPKSLISDEEDEDFRTPPESRSFHSSRDSRRIDRRSIRSDEYHDAPTFVSDEDLLARVFATSQSSAPAETLERRRDFRDSSDKDSQITTDLRRFTRRDVVEKPERVENLEATLPSELIDEILRMTVGDTKTAANMPSAPETVGEPEIAENTETKAESVAEEPEIEKIAEEPKEAAKITENEPVAEEPIRPVEIHSDAEEIGDGPIGLVELPLTDDEADRHSIASSAPEELIAVMGQIAEPIVESRIIEPQPPTQTLHFEYVRGTLHKAADDADAIPWRHATFRPKSIHEEQFALSADDILARVFRGENLRFVEAAAAKDANGENPQERQLATGFAFPRRRASANRRRVEIPELLSDDAYERIFNPATIPEEPEEPKEEIPTEADSSAKSPRSPLVEHVLTHADHDPMNRVETPTPKHSIASGEFRPRKSVRIADTVEDIAAQEELAPSEEEPLDLEKYGHLQPPPADEEVPQPYHPEDVFLTGGRRRKDSAELKREEMAKAAALAEEEAILAATRSRKPTIEVIDERDLRRIATISDRHDLEAEVPHLVLKKQLSAAEAVLMKTDSQEAAEEPFAIVAEPEEQLDEIAEMEAAIATELIQGDVAMIQDEVVEEIEPPVITETIAEIHATTHEDELEDLAARRRANSIDEPPRRQSDPTSSPVAETFASSSPEQPESEETQNSGESHRRIRHDTPLAFDSRPPPLFDDFSFIEEIVRESMLRPHRAHHQYRPEIEHFRMSIVEECSEGTGTPRESTGSPVSRRSVRPMSGDIAGLFEGPLEEEDENEEAVAETRRSPDAFASISSAAASRLIDKEFAEIAAQSSASDADEHSAERQNPPPARGDEKPTTRQIDSPFGPLHIDVPTGTAARPPRDPPNDSGVSVGTNSSGALTIDFPLLVQNRAGDTPLSSVATTSREDRSSSPTALPATDLWAILGRAHTEAAHHQTQSSETQFSDESEERVQHGPRPSMADSDDGQSPFFAVRLRTPPPKSPLAPHVAIASRRPPLIPVRDEHSETRQRRFTRHPASASPFDSSLESQKDFIALGGAPRRIQRRRRDEQQRFGSSADSDLFAEMEAVSHKRKEATRDGDREFPESGDIKLTERSKSATALNEEERESRHRRVHHSLHMHRRPKSASPLGGGRLVVEHTNITEIVFESRGDLRSSTSTEVLTTRATTRIDSLSAESLLHELLVGRARDEERRRRRRDQLGVRERMGGNRRADRRDPEFGRRRDLHTDAGESYREEAGAEARPHRRAETSTPRRTDHRDKSAETVDLPVADSTPPFQSTTDDDVATAAEADDFRRTPSGRYERSAQTRPLSLCCRMRIRRGDLEEAGEQRAKRRGYVISHRADGNWSESSPSSGSKKQRLYTVRTSTMPRHSRASSDSTDEDLFTVTTTSDPHLSIDKISVRHTPGSSWIVSSVCRTTADGFERTDVRTERDRPPSPNSPTVSPPATTKL